MHAKHGIAVLRIGISALMLTHGWGKLMMLFTGDPSSFPDPLGVGSLPSLIAAIGAEFVCALFCLVGYRTRIAAIPIVFTMAVAALVVHASDDFRTKELAIVYGVAFLALVLGGSGAPSIDLSLRRRNLDEV